MVFVKTKKCFLINQFDFVCFLKGVAKHAALFGPEQSDEAAEDLSDLDGPCHERVLSARRPRALRGPRGQPHVRQIQREHRKISSIFQNYLTKNCICTHLIIDEPA